MCTFEEPHGHGRTKSWHSKKSGTWHKNSAGYTQNSRKDFSVTMMTFTTSGLSYFIGRPDAPSCPNSLFVAGSWDFLLKLLHHVRILFVLFLRNLYARIWYNWIKAYFAKERARVRRIKRLCYLMMTFRAPKHHSWNKNPKSKLRQRTVVAFLGRQCPLVCLFLTQSWHLSFITTVPLP